MLCLADAKKEKYGRGAGRLHYNQASSHGVILRLAPAYTQQISAISTYECGVLNMVVGLVAVTCDYLSGVSCWHFKLVCLLWSKLAYDFVLSNMGMCGWVIWCHLMCLVNVPDDCYILPIWFEILVFVHWHMQMCNKCMCWLLPRNGPISFHIQVKTWQLPTEFEE